MLGRRLRFLFAMVLVTACGGGEDAVPDEVTGVIIDITAEQIGQIESFTLKAGDETHEIYIDPERSYGFALSHLHEHLVSSEPVVVELEHRSSRLIALSIEDA